MPHQNRVTPFNQLIATPARGTLMGNRGILHDAKGKIVRPYAHRSWIACVLSFKGRQRRVLTAGRYTELFFLDEATALAAGHRPCAECRRADFLRFKAAWCAADGGNAAELRVKEMDGILQPERVTGRGKARRKPTHEGSFGALPEGVLFHLPGDGEKAFLKWEGRAWLWSPEGYRAGPALEAAAPVSVLTPRPMLAALRAGYLPGVHPSALHP